MPEQYRVLLWMIIIFLGFPVYFLPAFLAGRTEHPKRRSILLWNVLTAWTGVAWVILLFVSARKKSVPPEDASQNDADRAL